MLPAQIDGRSLTSLQQRLVTTGAFDKVWPVPLRQHVEEDRNAAVASGIGGPQRTADFGGEMGRKMSV